MLATVAPPRHLPITIELRRTGATIISRRKPNSLSQTNDAAWNMAMNMTEMHRIPGKMKVFRLTPWVPALARRWRPEPSTNRNSSGCTSDVTMRSRLLAKRIELALPDDLDRAQLGAQAALWDCDPDDRAARGRWCGFCDFARGGHRRIPDIICIITRLRCLV